MAPEPHAHERGARDDDELRALWRRFKDGGDPAAREQLILSYAPLVKFVAGRMRSALPAHVEESDLISYGLVGLIGAVERFDPDRGVKFETYAVSRIKGAVIDELRHQDWVPRSVRSAAREIERNASELEHRLQRAPSDVELAEALEMEVDELHETLTQISNSSIVALDDMWTVNADSDALALIDTIGDIRAADPAGAFDADDARNAIGDAIARLPEREKIVIALYYYDGLTLREIGDVLGVTESRVSQLHTKAVLRLRGSVRAGPRSVADPAGPAS